MENYNGVSLLIKEKWLSSESLHLYTDAAKSCGFSMVFEDAWAYGVFSNSEKSFHISVLELYRIVVALTIWAEELSNKCVKLHCDNIAVVHMINKQTGLDKSAMSLLRFMTVNCMTYNIYVKASYIPRKCNTVADLISRRQVHKARLYQPSLNKLPVMMDCNWSLSKLLIKY